MAASTGCRGSEHAAFDLLAVPVAIVGADGIVGGVNRAFTEAFGWRSDQLTGHPISELVSEAHPLGDAQATLRTADGRVRDVQMSVRRSDAFTTVVLHDLTATLARTREAERVASLYATLESFDHALREVRSPLDVYRMACRVAAAHNGFLLVWIGRWDRQSQAVVPVAAAGEVEAYAVDLCIPTDGRPGSEGPVTACIRDERTVVVEAAMPEFRDCRWQSRARGLGLETVAAIPIRCFDALWGVFVVYAGDRATLGDREMSLLETLAVDVALAVQGLDLEVRRQAAEEALARSERDFASILREASDGFAMSDMDGRLVAVNERYCAMTGYSAEELIGRHIWELDARLSQQVCLESLRSLTPEHGARIETLHRRRDGSLLDVEVTVNLLPGPERRAMAFVRDITDRKRAAAEIERRLRLQEQLERIASTVPGAIYSLRLHPDGHLSTPYASPNWPHLAGVAVDDSAADMTSAFMVIHPDDRERVITTVAESARTLTPWREEFRVLHPQRGELWLDGHSVPSREADGSTLWFGYIRDNTDRRQAEERLRNLQRAVDQSTSIIVITDAEARIEYVNRRFTEVTGYTEAEVLGQNPRILQSGQTPPEVFRQMWSTLARGLEWQGDFHNVRKNGERFLEHAVISPIHDERGRVTHYLAVKEDVTERRELEARLRQSQKMEALGQLAGGVAHDFNNLLLVITGYCDYLVEEALPEPFHAAVAEIEGAARRASELTRQLLAFSRRQSTTPKLVDLVEIVGGTLKMLRRLMREDVVVTFDPPVSPVTVFADAGMLDQVVLNLALNARDAMPAGGTLRIDVLRADFPRESARCGAWAMLRVADSGLGIQPELLPRILEPFLTTKPKGKGTGLGLATVYAIVEQHQGWIDVDSVPSRGTEFRVYLPALDAAPDTDEALARGPASGAGERILLVEDEASVRELLRHMLIRLGYDVVTAADGAQALAVFCAEHDRFDLVLTDVVMPGGLSGHELGRRLRERRADVRLLYLSGYSADTGVVLQEGTDFISKPCSARQLGEKIRQVLVASR